MFYDQNYPSFDDFLFSGLDFMLYKLERIRGNISLKGPVLVWVFSLDLKNIYSCFRCCSGPRIVLLLFSKG